MSQPPHEDRDKNTIPEEDLWETPEGFTFYRAPNGQWLPLVQGPPAAEPAGQNMMAPPHQAQPMYPPTHGHHGPYMNYYPPPGGPAPLPAPPNIPPSLIPLPPQTVTEVADLSGHQPSEKVAGKRRAGSSKQGDKGKGRAEGGGSNSSSTSSSQKRKRQQSDDEDVPRTKGKRGRAKGTTNYTEAEIDFLLDLLEEFLPPGGKGWAQVGGSHRVWAKKNRHPLRTDKSLEGKFKQLVKTPRPTGDAEVPPHVSRAWLIDNAIQERVGTMDLDDEDIVDNLSHISISDSSESGHDSDDNNKPKPKSASTQKARIVKQDPIRPLADGPAPRRTRNGPNAGLEVLNKLSANLDPAVQAQRANERAATAFQTTHIMALNQQVRDLHAEIMMLRQQVSDAERRYHDSERRADRAEQQLQFTRLLDRRHHSRSTSRGRRSRVLAQRSHSAHRYRTRSTPRRRFEIFYPEGGRSSYWGYPEDAPQQRPGSPPLEYRETLDSPFQNRDPDQYRGPESYVLAGPSSSRNRLSSEHTVNAAQQSSGSSRWSSNLSITVPTFYQPAEDSNETHAGPSSPSSESNPKTPSNWAPSPF
ncbi:hypothetical protein BXZ70DRAFT_906334 [Cristinia sonorae]|uniref:DUF6818 domain-containing protein n=1 Tax=Cristinia sonorae TaxID=1940300 RepID=A0A8K0UPV4_9AGAR|nr:hypothetical protein BXZ70DRAFT_906334 [Cristinia sonorae]